MATPEQELRFQALYSDGKDDHQIGTVCGVTRHAVRRWRVREGLPAIGGNARFLSPSAQPKPFDVPDLPDENLTAEELIARRKADFSRKDKAKQARKLIPVHVRMDGPIGIAHFGDPHVDDDGTDIGLLERHVAVVNRTPGMFAGNVGDYTNNWIGRIAHLYGQQSTTAKEGLILAEWLLRAMDWLYLVGGNHDAWSGDGDPVQWVSRQQGSMFGANGVRLNLILPSGREVRNNARHDFKGYSMWNDAHGPSKAAQMGWRDHILACGHMHTSGYAILKDPASGLITRAFRVASYKTHDRYAEEKQLPDKNIFVCPVTIIDPRYADDDPRFIHFVEDPEEGADYLTWKRSRKAA